MILWERRQGRNRRKQCQQCLWKEGNVGWEEKNERNGLQTSQNWPESKAFQSKATLQMYRKVMCLIKTSLSRLFCLFFLPSSLSQGNWSTEPCLYLFCLLNRILKLCEVEVGLMLSCQRKWKPKIIKCQLHWELKSEWLLRFVLFVMGCK